MRRVGNLNVWLLDFCKPNRAIPILLFFLLRFGASAQKLEGANWLFGDSIGLSFNQGLIPQLNNFNRSKSDRGPASISDPFGKLLFYTDGDDIYNVNGQLMPNGDNISAGGRGTAKSSIITKVPGSLHRYWVLVAGGIDLNVSELRYTEVDMRLNNGLGGIVEGKKNLLIQTEVFIGMALADHANGIDKWLIINKGRKAFNQIVPPSYRYEFYLVSNSGINFVKAQQAIYSHGIEYEDQTPNFKVSPNSESLIIVGLHDEIKLFNIAKDTGGFTRMVLVSRSFDIGYPGIAFSPNSKFLYLAGKRLNLIREARLYQFNLDTSMVQSPFPGFGSEYPSIELKKNVYESNLLFLPCTDLQLAPNGKIYIIPYKGAKFLGSIECPDIRGSGCGFKDTAVWLNGKKTGSHFPVLNQTLFVNAGKLQAQASRDTICVGDSVEILAYGAGAEQFQWFKNQETVSFSSSGQIKVAPGQTTTYRVKGTGICANKDTSVKVVVVPRPIANLGADRKACGGQTVTFSNLTQNNVRYFWQTNLVENWGATTNPVTIPIIEKDSAYRGFVAIAVTNSGCTIRDTLQVSVFPTPKQKPTLSPFPDTAICAGQSVVLIASSVPGFKTIWSTGDSSNSISVSSGGNYSVRFKSVQGCVSDSSNSVQVTVHPLPIAQTLSNHRKDTTVCFPAQISLGINPQANVNYNWQGPTDSLSNSIISNPAFHFANKDTVIQTVNYQLSTVNSLTGCRNKDSLQIKLVPFLRPDAGKNVAYCNGLNTMIGKKGFAGFQYNWSPTEGIQNPNLAQATVQLSNPSFEQIRMENIIRNVSLLGCEARDTVQIQVFPSVPKPVLEGPQFVCPGVQNVPYHFTTVPALSTFDLLVYTFNLTGGDSTGQFTVNWNAENPNAGIRLKLGNIYGCAPDSFFLPVNVTRNLQPKTTITAGINDSLCLASAQDIGYNILPFNPKSRYKWEMNPFNITSTTPSFDLFVSTFNVPGTFQLTLSESDTTPIAQCFGKADYTIRIWPQPTGKQVIGRDSMCVNSSDELLVMNYELTSQYNWNAILGSIENINPNGGKVNYSADFQPTEEFTKVKIANIETSEKGCVGPENEKFVTVESLPVPQIVSPSAPLEWKALSNRMYVATGRISSYFDWTAENGTVIGGQGTKEVEIDWSPNQLIYRLKLREITRIGCVGETEFQTVPYDSAIFIPNLITPNGDSKNDRLEIKNLQFHPENELTIYNRWGKKVFESSPYQQNWPTENPIEGSYFFFFKAGKYQQKGWVMVSR